ncbi:MAG: hypothetical protein AB1810_04355 [Pseudomonadota bacterium]
MKISSALIPFHPRAPALRPDAERMEREDRRIAGGRQEAARPQPRTAADQLDLASERQRKREEFLHAARMNEGLSFTARQALGEYRKTSLNEEQAELRELLGVDVFV